MGIKVDMPTPDGPRAALLALVRALRAEAEVIAGEKALGLAYLIHALGLDSPGERWGNAYLRCPCCGAVREIQGFTALSVKAFALCANFECSAVLGIADLRLSEGWVEWAMHEQEFPSC